MPFYPGPGLGGHASSINPFYLTWKAREFGGTRLHRRPGRDQQGIADHVVRVAVEALNDDAKR